MSDPKCSRCGGFTSAFYAEDGAPALCGMCQEILRHTVKDRVGVRQQTLDTAKAAVADRGVNYGSPEDNFTRIAALWSTHLTNRREDPVSTITPADVAIMLAMVKIARLQNDPTHQDSWVDIAGYAACGAEVAAKKDA